MNPELKTSIILLLTALFIAGCSSSPSPYNDPDSQRSRSDKSQGEMPSDTSR